MMHDAARDLPADSSGGPGSAQQATRNGTIIQRAGAAVVPAASQETAGEIDIEKLADMVYRRMREELMLEWERGRAS